MAPLDLQTSPRDGRLHAAQGRAAGFGSLPFGQQAVWAVALLLVVGYTAVYLGMPSLPGNDHANPLGWWGWFDQSMTLRSTAALVHRNLDFSQHHYPLGYSLLGVPFYRAMPSHPFFFVDLASLLAAYAGFVALARRLALPGAVAAVLFALVTLGDKALFQQWVVPWNTTPVAAFMWLLLAVCAAWVDGSRRPLCAGLLLGAIVACRPSDAVIAIPCLLTLLWAERRTWRLRRPDALWFVAGAALVVLPVVALHLAIYGPAESLYMKNSARIGFTLFDFGWKAYVLLIDPYPWFADGQGLLQHAHWIALGIAGLFPALVRGPKARMLAAVLLVHATLYISYVDLLPTGLWRFLNIHYFAWAIPGFALLAAALIRDLVAPPSPRPWLRWLGAASAVATLLVLCLRVVPTPVTASTPAKTVDFAGPLPPFTDTFLGGRLALRDANGVLHDYHDFRAFLYPGGVRVVGLRQDMVGPLAWLPGHAPIGYEGSQPNARWGIAVQFAWPPRWLRRAAPPGIPVPVS